MTIAARVLPEAWARQVRATGGVDVATLSQAQLAAAGIQLSPAATTDRKLLSSFDRLDDDDRQRAIDGAASVDPAVTALVASVVADPSFRGTWMKTPAWHRPLDASDLAWSFGFDLPDGSVGVLDAAIDLTTSVVGVSVRTVTQHARSLAAAYFAVAPAPVDGNVTGWTDESGGGLAQLTLVWPHRSTTRAANWRITRTSDASQTAFLQARRDFGMKRSTDATVSEAELATRLEELFGQAAAEGFRRG